MSDDENETPLEQLAAGVTVALVLAVAFGLLALGYPWFWIAFPVGFGGVLPAAIALAKLYERRAEERERIGSTTDERERALALLRERYAAGEIDEAEFERRVGRLLQTETVADAEGYVDRSAASTREPTEPTRETAESERDR
ncbi:MAG: SHOCT domain-containing protein [Halobacteriota archaeon]